MIVIELDGDFCTTTQALHDHLQQRLCLPDHYGRNLDALHDLLTEPRGPVRVLLRHRGILVKNLGSYGTVFLTVLEQAARANPQLDLLVEP